LYIYNLILGLLLVNKAINLHKSSKCEVPSSFKDFVGTATTASGAGAATFMVSLDLALFVLCLMAIMLLAEENESLFSCMEEYKGNCPLSNKFLIPTVAALVMPPAGQRSHRCPSFQWSIHDTISIRLIIYHIIQKHEAI
jgi:hypothetical protein